MNGTANRMRRMATDADGQDMIEYALLLGFISGVILLVLIAAGQSINTIWGAVNAAFAVAGA